MNGRMPSESLNDYARRLRAALADVDREVARQTLKSQRQAHPLSAYNLNELLAEVDRRTERHDD